MSRKTRIALLATVSSLLLPVFGRGQSPAPLSIPEAVLLDGALLTAAVPDLHRTLDACQELMDAVMKETGVEFDLKAQLGGLIQDPELNGIPEGSGAALVWDGTVWYALLECDRDTAEILALMTSETGMESAVMDGQLLLSQNAAGLEAGKAGAAKAAEQLLNGDRTGGTVVVNSADLIEEFRPQINMGLIMMTNMMAYSGGQAGAPSPESMKGLAKFLEGEMRVLLSMASQIEVLDLSVTPSGKGLSFSQTMRMKEGSHLHRLITAPDVLQPDPAISVELLEPAMVGIEIHLSNPEALQTYLQAETDQLVTDMMLQPEAVEKWKEMLDMWTVFMGGSMAETVNIDPESGMSIAYILSMADEKAFLNIMEQMPIWMEPFTRMYEDMGMPMKMEMNLNSREYKGHAVHAYDFGYELDQMDPDMAAPLEQMNMADLKSEFTVVDNRLLWAMGSFPLNQLADNMIEGKKSGKPLFARRVYPDGGFLYYDLNMGLYMKYISAFMPLEEMKEMFAAVTEKLKAAPPLTGAGFQQGNRVQWRMDLPVALLETFAHFRAVESSTTMELPE